MGAHHANQLGSPDAGNNRLAGKPFQGSCGVDGRGVSGRRGPWRPLRRQTSNVRTFEASHRACRGGNALIRVQVVVVVVISRVAHEGLERAVDRRALAAGVCLRLNAEIDISLENGGSPGPRAGAPPLIGLESGQPFQFIDYPDQPPSLKMLVFGESAW